MTLLIGSESKRTLRFGKRHPVAVLFTRIDGLWHAHAALLPKPVRNIRDARIAVRDRLARLGNDGGE